MGTDQRNIPGSGFWVTAIAVSTGGPQTLDRLIPALSASYPLPIVVVQHMPSGFTQTLARALDAKSALKVIEATAGLVLKAGTVYIAPGDRHLVIRQVNGQAVTSLNDNPPVLSVRPSADVLFNSLAKIPRLQGVLAVVLTGMGEDGVAGVRELKARGGYCLSQTRETCVVYGMPRAVDLAGLSDESVPLPEMARRMTQLTARVRSSV